MDFTLMFWLSLAAIIIASFGIGFIAGRQFSGKPGEARLDDLQERFDTYQSEVASRLQITAQLMNNLNQSHQEMQKHLTESAQHLSIDEQARNSLLTLLHAAPEKSNELPQVRHEAPPKDYAPHDPSQPSTLDEAYGLKPKN